MQRKPRYLIFDLIKWKHDNNYGVGQIKMFWYSAQESEWLYNVENAAGHWYTVKESEIKFTLKGAQT